MVLPIVTDSIGKLQLLPVYVMVESAYPERVMFLSIRTVLFLIA